MKFITALVFSLFFLSAVCFAQPTIYANQVGFDTRGPKIALVSFDHPLTRKTVFNVVNASTQQTVFTAVLSGPETIDEWTPGKVYYRADFSAFNTSGKYAISVTSESKTA